MIETMSQKLDEHIAVSQKYPVLSKDCKKHLSDLDTFFVNNIMTFDYNFRDISCDLSDELKIGSGSFANVYLGVMKANNQEVALKIANEVIQKSNVTDVLTEDKIMRYLFIICFPKICERYKISECPVYFAHLLSNFANSYLDKMNEK